MKIKSEALINAPINRVFDISRNMDFHVYSVRHAGESIIDGVAHGLIGLNETVTFKGKHFGFNQIFTAKIVQFNYPSYFVDEMISGSFKSFNHRHGFKSINGSTLMIDEINYKCPFGILGTLVDRLIINSYLSKIFASRVQDIKACCEGNDWIAYK